MEIIVLLIFVFIIGVFFLFRKTKDTSNTLKNEDTSNTFFISCSNKEAQKTISQNQDWLGQRWTRIEEEEARGERRTVKDWYFDEPTNRQIEKLGELGVEVEIGSLKKGQLSDIIGFFEPIKEHDKKVLQHFKVSLKGMNETKGRENVEKLFLNETNRESWRNRPAEPFQKEFYRFFKQKLPPNLSFLQASDFISDYLDKVSDEEAEEWEAYEELYDNINDPETKEAFELKNVSIPRFREVVDLLKKEGKTIKELSDDSYIVIKKFQI